MPNKVNVIQWNKTRRFGVEFEFNVFNRTIRESQRALRDAILSVGQRVEIRSWERTVNNWGVWVIKTDSSCGIEAVTPPLSGPNDLKMVGEVIKKFNEIGAKFDNRCGLHVHLSLEDFEFQQMCILLMYWIKIETVIMNAHPEHRRKNQYCKPLNEYIGNWQVNQYYSPEEVYQAFYTCRGALNTNYWESRKILEWRMGEMTLDPEDIKNRVRFLIWFTDIAKILGPPENLNWFTTKQTMFHLGLLPSEADGIKKVFSPAIQSMKKWILTRLQANLPGYYKIDKQLVQEMLDSEKELSTQ